MSTPKRPSSSSPSHESKIKRLRPSSPIPTSQPPSVHAWLHPDLSPPLMAHSPALHEANSTFVAFTLSLIPPPHITTETSLVKEAKRMVRDLDVVGQMGSALLEQVEGAFQNGEGKAPGSRKGKERAREPDHRMWAVRALCLKEGRNGTGGEDDYQLLETFNDDGEKFGGERVLRVLRENKGVDVLTVCCRWFGGDMIGPVRFQHIGTTSHTSLISLLKLVTLGDLRTTLETLDEDIASMRKTLKASGASRVVLENGSQTSPRLGEKGKYDDIEDAVRLERLVSAREKTRASLEGRTSWVGLEQTRAEKALARNDS
ncbi:hypothetical protein TREMEDRAFT_30797 [Tremella mesenterica DSM 1558]|uniref:uncharacterized protein n=1 Tax=Tremella mesenterica (strain ATCC 24925 / CBS 8224 / DSM 1558 / NBRC 9311 / NRRL Y-6157 / RJB 2259-6 / UBC 559-6) TaxID=578456 RepID=UPI0003F49662|nr:uncharacterized protein TREMEDRAFT_30797 [Tremella mesenterica DSM 1558]EIW69378.1 hypothetical protein TREMEDRAFT_30797 [Tremella mesenterica DSM 1558]